MTTYDVFYGFPSLQKSRNKLSYRYPFVRPDIYVEAQKTVYNTPLLMETAPVQMPGIKIVDDVPVEVPYVEPVTDKQWVEILEGNRPNEIIFADKEEIEILKYATNVKPASKSASHVPEDILDSIIPEEKSETVINEQEAMNVLGAVTILAVIGAVIYMNQ